MDNIKIERGENGYLLRVDDGDGQIKRFAFEVDDDNLDGLRDGFLDMMSTIIDACGESGNKHDKIRVFIGYRTYCSDKERTELQKKTDWEIT